MSQTPAVAHRPASPWTLVALVFLVCLVLPTVAFADGPLDQQARDIAKDLQCPICENLSVADSPSELATQMRASIRDQLEAGRSRQEIEAYFVARYGESVLRNPPKEGFNLLVWWVPAIALVVATVLVVSMLWNRRTSGPSHEEDERPLTPQEREQAQRVLQDALHPTEDRP